MTVQLTVEEVKSIEWYDGVATGFVRSRDKFFLCVLLALDAASAQRCYLLVPLVVNSFPSVDFADVGAFFRSTIEDALSNDLKFYATCEEPIAGREIDFEERDYAEISEMTALSFPRIDDAVLATSVARLL